MNTNVNSLGSFIHAWGKAQGGDKKRNRGKKKD
jgi:hypothetical protein